jgi:hypothetical protein
MENSNAIACRSLVDSIGAGNEVAQKSGSCNVIKEVAIAKVTHSLLPAKPYRIDKPTHFSME